MQDIKVLTPPTNIADLRHRLKAVAAVLIKHGARVIFEDRQSQSRTVISGTSGDIYISTESGSFNALGELVFTTDKCRRIPLNLYDTDCLSMIVETVGMLMLCEQSMLSGGDMKGSIPPEFEALQL